jgi:hypothetical protein
VTSMEIMDSIDSLNPVYGDCVDFIPTYIGGRHNGLASERTYTSKKAYVKEKNLKSRIET